MHAARTLGHVGAGLRLLDGRGAETRLRHVLDRVPVVSSYARVYVHAYVGGWDETMLLLLSEAAPRPTNPNVPIQRSVTHPSSKSRSRVVTASAAAAEKTAPPSSLPSAASSPSSFA